MRALVRMLAAHSGQTIAPNKVGSAIGLAHPTVERDLGLLELGVAAGLLGMTSARLRKIGAPLGKLLEGFVAMEIARQLTWSSSRAELSHYRTRDGIEVDIVLENTLGEVVAVEVKASATPSVDDFRGIRHLADRIGDDLIAGFVLHTGTRTFPFGPKFRAVPISALWQVAAP